MEAAAHVWEILSYPVGVAHLCGLRVMDMVGVLPRTLFFFDAYRWRVQSAVLTTGLVGGTATP